MTDKRTDAPLSEFTVLAIKALVDFRKDDHPSEIVAMPFALAEWRGILAAQRSEIAPTVDRNTVLEEAANMCESNIASPISEPFMQHCADQIRALKNAAPQGVAQVETTAARVAPAAAAPSSPAPLTGDTPSLESLVLLEQAIKGGITLDRFQMAGIHQLIVMLVRDAEKYAIELNGVRPYQKDGETAGECIARNWYDSQAVLGELATERNKSERLERELAERTAALDRCDDARINAEAALSATSSELREQIPEGMVLVPREPTGSMLECGYKSKTILLSSYDIVRTIYRAMLSAAPQEARQERHSR